MGQAFDDALSAGTTRVGVFFRLAIPTPFRFWLGIGDCRAGIDSSDGTGEIYTGLGEILTVPAFQQLINGTADRVSFEMSGVNQRIAQMASQEADDVKGVELKLGLGVFDSRWQIIESPIWLRTFVVDYLTIKREQQASGEANWTVALAARSLLTGRRRPVLAYWTHNDQQARSPTDLFCQRVALYSVDVSKAWPRLA
jgi:hypothetical protein